MKVAVLSESPVDELVVRSLVDGLLGLDSLPVGPLPLRSRGWPSVLQDLDVVLKHLYYQTDADALALVVDSNHSRLHDRDCDGDDCRLCLLRASVTQTTTHLRLIPGRRPFRTAVGIAVPAIEAWLLCGNDQRVSETAWVNGQKSGRDPYSKLQLKNWTYGTERPTRGVLAERSTLEAGRLRGNVPLLETSFPVGFGALAADVRNWR